MKGGKEKRMEKEELIWGQGEGTQGTGREGS